MIKPFYKDIYIVLREIGENGISTQFWDEEHEVFEGRSRSTYLWLKENDYVTEHGNTRFTLKDMYKDKVTSDETMGFDYTADGKEAPEEYYQEHFDIIARRTLKAKIFMNNYKNILKRIEYQSEDYPIIIPSMFGFLGGIFSSIVIWFLIGK